MINKKYVSTLYDHNLIKSNRLNVIYAPMGSGKTTLFKELLINQNCLMVAPYRSCLDDFGLAYKYGPNKTGLDHEFLYTGDLIDEVTDGWANKLDITNEKAIEKATRDYVHNMPPVSFTHILFDEVDFMWLQANMTWIGNSRIQVRDAKIWEYILKALATKFILIGQTSTRIPKSVILDKGGQIQRGAHTSVRFDSITPVLVNKDVTHNQLFKMAMDDSMIEAVQRPTLVYKQKFTGSDVNYINGMVKKGKRILIVLRKENSPMVKGLNKSPVDVLTKVGAVEAMSSGISLQATHLHYKIISKDTALDKITPSADPYSFFDYIFINTSSSRQVSLKAVRGDESIKVRVITIDSKLNNTSHQVAGRFRENRVEIIHYLKGYTKTDIPLFSGLELWKKLLNIDLTMPSYMEHGGVSNPDVPMSGQAKSMQYHRKAKWIGKTVKRQATKNQIHRLDVIKSWLKSIGKQKQTYVSYQGYCKSHGESPFGKNTFKAKLTEAKNI